MKNMKKLFALLVAVVMVFAMTTVASAAGAGSITVSNAAKGETYKIYKLFDASVTGTVDGSIAYTGTIPAALTDYFTQDTAGNITATEAAKTGDSMSDGLKAALKTWTATATVVKTVEATGTAVVFDNLDYGYYVVTTSQGNQAISVDSTNPTATIVDKNSTTVTNLTKNADKDNVKIGDTVTYTVSFDTANYNGEKKIVSYTIEDTLPTFLKDVTVTKIKIDDTEYKVAEAVPQFDETNKNIGIPWVSNDVNKDLLYKNGAKVVITYTAVVTDAAAVAGDGNTNTVTLKWTDEDGTTPTPLTATETIKTYALALKKVNQEGKALAGAEFEFPFYVKETADSTDGAYIYAGTTAGEGLTNKITTPADGVIVVKGLASGEAVSITETKAPAGYNKLTAPVSVTPQATTETTTNRTFYVDTETGNVVTTSSETTTTVTLALSNIAATPVIVVNMTGSELPSTGGIGTTIFYVVGGLLVVGAAIVLISKKRMSKEA